MPLCCAETVLLTLKERKAKHKHVDPCWVALIRASTQNLELLK